MTDVRDLIQRTRLGGFFVAHWKSVIGVASLQFWGGHPNTFRGLFAWASMSLSVFMLIEPEAFLHHSFDLMRFLMPVFAWAALFLLHWVMVSWVVLKRPRVAFSLVVNVYGAVLWSGYVVLQDLSIGYFALNSSAERVMVIYSVWALLRTGMGRGEDA